jgi:hypothetical protein
MPRKKKITLPAKVMSYHVKQDVLNAIECIMKREPQLNTIHKVIDRCIIQYLLLCESINKSTDQLIMVTREKKAIEYELSKLVQFLDYLKKHTKTS